MNALVLISTILLCTHAIGQEKKINPQTSSGKSSKSNHSGWQYSRWGMTADQIVAASKGNARKIEGDEQEGSSNKFFTALALAEFSSGPFNFHVFFLAAKDGLTLKKVRLQLKDSTQYQELKAALTSKYGKGALQQSSGYTKEEIQWLSNSEVITLTLYDVEVMVNVYLEYSERLKNLAL
jgi:hypothetical protein